MMNGLPCNVTGSTYYTIECETSAYTAMEQTAVHLGGRGLAMYSTKDLTPSGDLSTLKWKAPRHGSFTECDLRCYYDNKRIALDAYCDFPPCTDYEIREHWLENGNDWRDCLCGSAADGNASRVEAMSRYQQYGPHGDIYAQYSMQLLPEPMPMSAAPPPAPTPPPNGYRRRRMTGGASGFSGR